MSCPVPGGRPAWALASPVAARPRDPAARDAPGKVSWKGAGPRDPLACCLLASAAARPPPPGGTPAPDPFPGRPLPLTAQIGPEAALAVRREAAAQRPQVPGGGGAGGGRQQHQQDPDRDRGWGRSGGHDGRGSRTARTTTPSVPRAEAGP